jgi:hypothetical protein
MDNGDGTYIAIDCNHRVVAFDEMGIKQAMCLVFPKLPKEEQEYIAGCANELHDEGCVHVTDWINFATSLNILRIQNFNQTEDQNWI